MGKNNKKKTTEEFKKEVYDLTNDEYLVLGDYTNCKTKIKFLHNKKECMNEFEMIPSNFLQGQRCPKCKCTGGLNKKTDEQFKKEVFDLVGNEYTVVGEYINAKTKINIKHNICGTIFNMVPANFLFGQRCPECKSLRLSASLRKSQEDFENEVKEKSNDEYIVLSQYINCKTKIKFLHKLCGQEFEMIAGDFIYKGARCTNKDCLHQRLSNSIKDTNEEFISKFKDRSKDEYELLSEYILSNQKIKIKHITCGTIFEMKPNNFLQGQGCPECSKKIIALKRTRTDEEYKQLINELYDNEFIVVSKYIKASEKVEVIHNVCGNKFSITAQSMLHDDYNHCPFCNYASKGEQRIINYLDSFMKDQYVYQKSYEDLVGVGERLLSYDFYLPQYNLLIEYQGQFHDGTAAQQTPEEFEIQKEHDRRKREYAKSHKIDLLEIWYWDFDNIEDILYNYLKNKENKKPVKIKYMKVS